MVFLNDFSCTQIGGVNGHVNRENIIRKNKGRSTRNVSRALTMAWDKFEIIPSFYKPKLSMF